MSQVFQAFVKSISKCLIVGSSYHKNTNAKVEQANCVICDTLCAYANGHKDDWDQQLPLAVFAINNVASTPGDCLTPFFIDHCTHPRLPAGCSSRPQQSKAASLQGSTRCRCVTWS